MDAIICLKDLTDGRCICEKIVKKGANIIIIIVTVILNNQQANIDKMKLHSRNRQQYYLELINRSYIIYHRQLICKNLLDDDLSTLSKSDS